MNRSYFTDRRIWITGASSGIGRAVALELDRRGAIIIASARSQDGLKQLARDAGSGRVHSLSLDVTDRQATLAAAQTIQQEVGGLDIAFFNAGTCEYVDVARFDSAMFERVLQTNFLGMVYGIEAALPLLRRSAHPHLVGMSSTVAYGGLPRAEAYGASKAAIKHMLESLRIDLVQDHIPVSIICPGFVETPLTDRNDFPMPFAISADLAARYIADGIAAQTHEIHFPKRFSLAFKLLALLPSRLYTAVGSKMVKSA
ncbi:MAG: SDR family NAD(P)-dependent oxidoreductase [Nitrospira sp.]|nr:SDR family NAD(P)-dependent oxidoreductase [Nitrospira sp.]